jgi:hypothetical protein
MIKSRMMRWNGYVGRIGEMRSAYKILVGKLEEKSPIGRPRLRSEHIRMDLKETGWEGVDWMHLHGIGTSGGLL